MKASQWPVEVKGVLYINPKHTCELLGISKAAFYKFKRTRQISTEEVISYYLNKIDGTTERKVSIKKEIKEIKENRESKKSKEWNLAKYCRDKGLSYSTMYRNINILKMSLEEAEKQTIHNDKYEVTYKSEKYRSLYDACIRMNLSYQRIYHRIKRGMTFEQAVDLDIERKELNNIT